MTALEANATFKEVQKIVAVQDQEKGQRSAKDNCRVLGENASQLFRLLSNAEYLGVSTSRVEGIEESVAEIFGSLCRIAYQLNVDIEKAVVKKRKGEKEKVPSHLIWQFIHFS